MDLQWDQVHPVHTTTEVMRGLRLEMTDTVLRREDMGLETIEMGRMTAMTGDQDRGVRRDGLAETATTVIRLQERKADGRMVYLDQTEIRDLVQGPEVVLDGAAIVRLKEMDWKGAALLVSIVTTVHEDSTGTTETTMVGTVVTNEVEVEGAEEVVVEVGGIEEDEKADTATGRIDRRHHLSEDLETTAVRPNDIHSMRHGHRPRQI